MLLSIIIPVYNEEKTIKKIVDLVYKSKLPFGLTKEVILIDDGSTDNSKKIIVKTINHYQKNKNNIKFLTIFKNKNEGKGSALFEGLKKCKGDIILIQDADLEYQPGYYPKLLEQILNKKTEVVFGSRLRTMKIGLFGKEKTPFISHYLTNRFLSFLTNLWFNSNLTDMETCYKVFTKKVSKQILPIQTKGFEVEPEITCKILKKGFKILEVDIQTTPRGYNEGKKIQWYDALKAIYTLFKFKFVINE